MIVGPMLLELGMGSRAAAATSALTVLITSASAVLQFAVLNLLLYDYSGWYFGVGVVATLIGQLLVNRLIAKYQRASIIILCITILIVVAAIMMTAQGIMSIVLSAQAGESFGPRDYCY